MATVDALTAPFEDGLRLTRDEFIRRWEEHPEINRAELIGRVVYMPSPVSREHGEKDNDVGCWTGVYKAWTPGVAGGHECTVFLHDDAPQADANLPECGGGARYEGKYLAGKPEFFGEVSLSSTHYDLHEKLELYQSAGIPEYLVVLMRERQIRWHVLENGIYALMPPDADGIWRSRVFPGLWLDGLALLDGNLAQVLTKLQEGLNSPEHQAFVERLRAAKQ
jgi:Uma2 family endonuclease